jgi:archaemetzincin
VSEIAIVPVGAVGREMLEYLAVSLPGLFGVRCRLDGRAVEPSDAYSPGRRQYHSTALLAQLAALDAGAGDKILGVADVDLFIPVFTFVFGEAQLRGHAALFSLRRLRQQFYGLPADDLLFHERCEKEAAHELGHTYGLTHCPRHECVMHFSNSVEQVDLKAGLFCDACEALLPNARRE